MDFLKKKKKVLKNRVCPTGSSAIVWHRPVQEQHFSIRRLVLIWCVVVWNAFLYIEYCDKRLQFKMKVTWVRIVWCALQELECRWRGARAPHGGAGDSGDLHANGPVESSSTPGWDGGTATPEALSTGAATGNAFQFWLSSIKLT